ncbi:MAG: Hsp33 family molecular chaperone HslO [Novosphingobium sp.]|nr:Hsp33 family molecular chaperone HslO [Novosphingobium sp.]
MKSPGTPASDETGIDQVLAFTLPDRNVRGRLVRLGPVLDAILSAHSYPDPIRHLLAEALVLTALLGSLVKDADSQLTFQIQAEGEAVDLLVSDFKASELRGYVRHDNDRIAGMGANPPLSKLIAEGFLAITYDLAATGERYQGIVQLEGSSLAEACETYFSRSEQVPTLLRVAVRNVMGRSIACGLLIQHLPPAKKDGIRLETASRLADWEHVSILADSIQHEEMTDPSLPPEQLVWRLFHAEGEIRIERLPPLVRGCRCTIEHFESVLKRFPESERALMREQDGRIPVDCAFCSRIFRVAV